MTETFMELVTLSLKSTRMESSQAGAGMEDER